jgi:hypothetical protein
VLARNPAAAKKRAYRRRLRAGRIVLKVEVGECELAEALIRAERVRADAALARDALQHEAEAILQDFVARMLCKP